MPVTNYYTANGQIIAEATSGVRTDYLMDALGSVTATVNQSGAIVNTYRHKPYGGLLTKTGVGSDPAFLWVGSQGYRQTGKKYSEVYIRARHYDTNRGRWTTKDSAAEFISLYNYVDNTPINLSDPSGLLTGTATCDNKWSNKTCNNTWCRQQYQVSYAPFFCNQQPCTKACPVYKVGMTGAFPNVRAKEDNQFSERCPGCPETTAKSTCRYNILCKTQSVPEVKCGQEITVSKGKCSVKIKIIDCGPAKWTNNLVDLHPQAAEQLQKCLAPQRTFQCKKFRESDVTVTL